MFTRTGALPGENYYTQVPTHWIRDFRLTGNAVRLLAFWVSHSVGYEVGLKQTIEETGMGRDAVYAAVKNLLTNGYLVRTQGRAQAGKMTAVEYDLGPAAVTPSYTRAWGNQEEAPGQTASGFSVSGQAVSGEPDPKKIKAKKTNEKKITPPLASPAPAVVAAVAEEEEENDTQTEPPGNDGTDALVAEVVATREGEWSPTAVRKALAHPDVAGRPAQLVAAALRLIAGNRAYAQYPGRLATDGPHWAEARRLVVAAAPAPRRPAADVPDWKRARTSTNASEAARAAARQVARTAAGR